VSWEEAVGDLGGELLRLVLLVGESSGALVSVVVDVFDFSGESRALRTEVAKDEGSS
jgi:hypothetical protein